MIPNQEKKFAIISNNSEIRVNAKTFFDEAIFANYLVLKILGNTSIICELYESEEAFDKEYTKLDGRDFIGGV